MKRLTFKEPSGKWGIVGMEKPVDEIEDFSIYICLEKLCDYEELGLNPNDIDSKLSGLREALREYKETGLTPDNIRRLKSKLEDMEENLQTIEKELGQLKSKIRVGTVIQGYKILGIVRNRCIAERVNKLDCDDYVVWNVDYDESGVNSGRYFKDYNSALSTFKIRTGMDKEEIE